MNEIKQHYKIAYLFYRYLSEKFKWEEYSFNNLDHFNSRQFIDHFNQTNKEPFLNNIFNHLEGQLSYGQLQTIILEIKALKINSYLDYKHQFNNLIYANKFEPKRASDHFITNIVVNIAKVLKPNAKTIYDPTLGSGEFLRVANNYYDLDAIYGEEVDIKAFNTAKMNIYLNDIPLSKVNLFNSDAIYESGVTGKFDLILSEPPYDNSKLLESVIFSLESFSDFKQESIRTISDFSFIIKSLSNLSNEGIFITTSMAHLLFKESSKDIRKKLIKDDNVLDVVIRLPENAYTNISVPIYILVFNKQRNIKDPINFINLIDSNVSKFNRSKKEAALIENLTGLLKRKEEVTDIFKKVSIEEIANNDYNLNFSRYFKIKARSSLINVNEKIYENEILEKQIQQLNKEIKSLIENLI